MIKKLNNKGMTSVEVLLSFIVVVVICVSMYTTVTSYQNKQNVESVKEKIMTYKNLLTKEINDDLIKRGLIAVTVDTKWGEESNREVVYSILFTFKNGEQRKMNVYSTKAGTGSGVDEDGDGKIDGFISASKDKDDYFMIEYGPVGSELQYPIPNLGSTTNGNNKIVYDLRINTVEISTDNGVFSILVGFTHQELENRYYITIVAPINF